MQHITVNDKQYSIDVPDDTPLLWVLREELKLTGTKFGCGKGLCGACTILLGDTATRSCVLPVVAAVNSPVTTIEGLSPKPNVKVSGEPQQPNNNPSTDSHEYKSRLHPVQQAWLLEDVVQCGYCQPGQIMMAVALLRSTPEPTDEQISQTISQNLCRCGTYPRIQKAVKTAVSLSTQTSKGQP